VCRDHIETGLFGGCGVRSGDAGLYFGGKIAGGFRRNGG